MIQYLVVGTCHKCQRPQVIPTFSEKPIRIGCDCQAPAIPLDLDSGKDRALLVDQEIQYVHAQQEPKTTLSDLHESALRLSVDVGIAQGALLNQDFRAAFVFLVKAAATIRHMTADYPMFHAVLAQLERALKNESK